MVLHSPHRNGGRPTDIGNEMCHGGDDTRRIAPQSGIVQRIAEKCLIVGAQGIGHETPLR